MTCKQSSPSGRGWRPAPRPTPKSPLTPAAPKGAGPSRCAPGAVSGTAPVGRGEPGARSAIFKK